MRAVSAFGDDGRNGVARRLNKNLVALGSAAIVAVYAVGYAHTQSSVGSAAAPMNAAATRAATQAAASQAISRLSIGRGSDDGRYGDDAAGARQAFPPGYSSATPSATAPVANGYRDGTYTGSASNRRGSLSVAVTIQGGRITDVQLTRYDMYYPASRIARLPGEVIDRQSANVDLVSGATYSAEAFRQAVAQALAQARA
jgi:uncharacterized protein with FMN-binding domain